MASSLYQALFVHLWPGWIAGPLVGLYAVGFFWFGRRNLGASSAFTAALEKPLSGPTMDLSRLDDPLRLPAAPHDPAPFWRLWWLAGLLCAGLLAWALGGTGTGSLELPGMRTAFPGWPLWAKTAALFAGGVLIGFGTRMSGGCTSGHAIFGISQRQAPSLYATLVFFGVGMATAFFWQWCLS